MDKILLDHIKKIIIQAGEMSLKFRQENLDIKKKQDGSIVSNADRELSNFIIKNLKKLVLEQLIICEEQDLEKFNNQRDFWLIDPIDGTESYVKNRDDYTVNIALIKNRQPEYGFIYHPADKLLYYTDIDKKLVIENNGKLANITPHLSKGLIAAVSLRSPESKTVKFFNNKNIQQVISLSSSLKLALVAAGLVDIYPQPDLTMEWDIAAGYALIKASGGSVKDVNGNKLIYGKKSLEHPPFIAMSKRYLSEV